MSRKLKNYEELKDIDLTGYCFYVDAWGMSMTSARSYEPECWIVLEDNKSECKIAKRNAKNWIKTSSKDTIARSIADNPAIDSETSTNLIEKI